MIIIDQQKKCNYKLKRKLFDSKHETKIKINNHFFRYEFDSILFVQNKKKTQYMITILHRFFKNESKEDKQTGI